MSMRHTAADMCRAGLSIVFAVASVVLARGATAASDIPSLCCPGDVSRDGEVGPEDLASLLAGWGGSAPDLDADGIVGTSDLALLLESWGPCAETACLVARLTGTIAFEDGTPAELAVVITDQGGQGVSDSEGNFVVDVEVVAGTETIHITAVATVDGITYRGSKRVSPVGRGDARDAGIVVVAADSSCSGDFGWLPGFGLPGLNGLAFALTVFDDGNGPALYVGGEFTAASGIATNHIARWDGTSWSPLGEGATNGVDAPVYALAVFDDGGGPALYAGGEFFNAGDTSVSKIARWDGSSWSALCGPPTFPPHLACGVSGSVQAMAVFDDGGGPALYVAGSFSSAGSVTAKRIARWDGATWASLGTGPLNGITGGVSALAVFDDGTGPALYAAGFLTAAGGMPANRIARWNGNSWSTLGVGPDNGVNDVILGLTVFDDGSGPALYAGGSFTTAGGGSANRIARWDGSSWSALGASSENGANGSVVDLAVFDDGDGPALFVGGYFETVGGVRANGMARWDGRSWSALGSGASNGVEGGVIALTVFDDGRGAALYAAGDLQSAGGVVARCIARWNGQSWSSLAPRPTNGVGGGIDAFAVFDDGDGPALYAGGSFTSAGGVKASSIARWNGSSWSPLGTGATNGVDGKVYALTVFDDGDGPALYAGGLFASAGGVAANRIARWDGRSWSPVGDASVNGVTGYFVYALTVFDDGTGPALYAGGWFKGAGGVSANRIARWDGKAWSSLGTGAANGVNDEVYALTVFDDGTGPALYVGGTFTEAGGVPANRIARWDGRSWSSLGIGAANGLNNSVFALTVFQETTTPSLFAAGSFENAGGLAAKRIARWDGTSWSSVGGGADASVHAMTVFDDGDGPALYAGGLFLKAGGVPAKAIARWDGNAWSSLGTGEANGVEVAVLALTGIDTPHGPGLATGGTFRMAGGNPAHRIAIWACIPTANSAAGLRDAALRPRSSRPSAR